MLYEKILAIRNKWLTQRKIKEQTDREIQQEKKAGETSLLAMLQRGKTEATKGENFQTVLLSWG